MSLYRSIWQARQRLGARASDTIVLFGCRTREDNLCSEEAVAPSVDGCDGGNDDVRGGSHLRLVAYSREMPNPKRYVQDLAFKNGKMIVQTLFEREGAVLVCGGVSQPEIHVELGHLHDRLYLLASLI